MKFVTFRTLSKVRPETLGARELVDLSTHLEDRAKDGELKDARVLLVVSIDL